MSASTNRNLKEKVYQQLKEFLIIAVYLWAVFGLLVLYKSAILAENNVDFARNGFALVNALALAKIMLIAKDLRLGETDNKAPLIYPTVLKSAIYTVLLAFFKVLEEAGVGMYRGKTFQESIAGLGGGSLQGILVLTLLLFVTLIPFVGFGELQRVLGNGKLKNLFLYPRPAEPSLSSRS